MLIECPSGLSFHARQWLVGDRKQLHDPQVVKQGLLMRRMLEVVDQGVEEPGPYGFVKGKPVPWSEVSLIDIIDALLAIRKAIRPVLDYTENCSACGAQNNLSVNLSELKTDPITSEGLRHLESSQPIKRTIAAIDGLVDVSLKMLRGKDMSHIAKLYQQDAGAVQFAQVVCHIEKIEAPWMEQPLLTYAAIMRFYEQQPWSFHEDLQAAIDSMGGGTNTTVATSCRRCQAEHQGTLPFGVEFFYPQRTQRSSSLVLQ